jgi:hypothetical protein
MARTKFMMSLAPEIIQQIQPYSPNNPIQEVIRARIIPDWLNLMQKNGVQKILRREYRRGVKDEHNRKVSRNRKVSTTT